MKYLSLSIVVFMLGISQSFADNTSASTTTTSQSSSSNQSVSSSKEDKKSETTKPQIPTDSEPGTMDFCRTHTC